METRYRLLPRQFGEYMDQRIVEYDEVCVATNTMSYEDYLECRGFSLIFLSLSSKQYDFLRPACQKSGVEWFDLLLKIWSVVKEDSGSLGGLYRQFIAASEEELFESPEELVAFVQHDENYKRLLSGEIGETIMRNFVPRRIIDLFQDTTNLAILILKQMMSDQSWLSDLQVWAIGSRDIAVYFDVENKVATESTVTLNWDIEGWLATPKDKSIGEFPSSKTFKVVSSGDEITRARDSMIKLYGPDRLRWSSRLLEAKPIEEMWQKFMPVEPVS